MKPAASGCMRAPVLSGRVSLQYNKAGAMELDFHSVQVHACLPSLSGAASLIHPDKKFPSPALFSDVCVCVHVRVCARPCRRLVVSYRGLFTAGWFGVREKHCSRLEIYIVYEQANRLVVRGLPMRPCFPHSICFSETTTKCISCSRRRGSDEFPVAAFLCLHSHSRFISQVSKYPRQRERAVKVALFILVSEKKSLL